MKFDVEDFIDFAWKVYGVRLFSSQVEYIRAVAESKKIPNKVGTEGVAINIYLKYKK